MNNEQCPNGKYDDSGICKFCHEYCVGGCSGPGPDTCATCKIAKYGTECVEECPEGTYGDNGVCKTCHDYCIGGCSGPGPESCTGCKDKKEECFCVKECSITKYDDNGICKPCNWNCASCSGPGAYDCNTCKYTKDDSVCVKECPYGKYDYNGECKGIFPYNIIDIIFKNYKNILACDCDSQGSTGTSCALGGVCDCKANIMGNKCTNCKPGYYGFPECKGISI